MSEFTRSRSDAAIIDAAARVLAAMPTATMSEISDRAGLSRATLYRHFPTRDALIDAISAHALDLWTLSVSELELDAVGTVEALGRLTRTLLSLGARYVTALKPVSSLPHKIDDPHIGPVVHQVLDRVARDGVIGVPIPVDRLATYYTALVVAGLTLVVEDGRGVEATAADIVGILTGTAARD